VHRKEVHGIVKEKTEVKQDEPVSGPSHFTYLQRSSGLLGWV
jgi:hypothetical protein